MTSKRGSPRSRSAKANSRRRADDRKIASLGHRSKASRKGKKSCHQVRKTNQGPWANLPVDILSSIIPHFSHLEDYMALSSICKSWKKFTLSEKKPPLPPRAPVLMIVRKVGYEREIGKYHENLAMSDLKNKLNIRVCKVKLPGPAYKRCMGINFGWVLTLDADLQISLLHPFSGEHKIQLPPNPIADLYIPERPFVDGYFFDLPPDPKYTSMLIKKAAVSSNPGSSECVVMGIFSRGQILAFTRPQDRSWTIIRTLLFSYDVIYHKDKFYSVDTNGVLLVCDIDDAKPSVRAITPAIRIKPYVNKYLVESAGDLFLVSSSLHITASGLCYDRGGQYQRGVYDPNELIVHKLEMITNDEGIDSWYWKQVHDLGNVAFMVGASTSVSFAAPGTNGFYKENHIYFTDYAAKRLDHYMTVVDMGSKTFESYWLNMLYEALPLPPFFYM